MLPLAVSTLAGQPPGSGAHSLPRGPGLALSCHQRLGQPASGIRCLGSSRRAWVCCLMPSAPCSASSAVWIGAGAGPHGRLPRSARLLVEDCMNQGVRCPACGAGVRAAVGGRRQHRFLGGGPLSYRQLLRVAMLGRQQAPAPWLGLPGGTAAGVRHHPPPPPPPPPPPISGLLRGGWGGVGVGGGLGGGSPPSPATTAAPTAATTAATNHTRACPAVV